MARLHIHHQFRNEADGFTEADYKLMQDEDHDWDDQIGEVMAYYKQLMETNDNYKNMENRPEIKEEEDEFEPEIEEEEDEDELDRDIWITFASFTQMYNFLSAFQQKLETDSDLHNEGKGAFNATAKDFIQIIRQGTYTHLTSYELKEEVREMLSELYDHQLLRNPSLPFSQADAHFLRSHNVQFERICANYVHCSESMDEYESIINDFKGLEIWRSSKHSEYPYHSIVANIWDMDQLFAFLKALHTKLQYQYGGTYIRGFRLQRRTRTPSRKKRFCQLVLNKARIIEPFLPVSNDMVVEKPPSLYSIVRHFLAIQHIPSFEFVAIADMEIYLPNLLVSDVVSYMRLLPNQPAFSVKCLRHFSRMKNSRIVKKRATLFCKLMLCICGE